jgi:lysyl-tRNA synthetase class 1
MKQMSTKNQQSNYWLDQVAEQIIAERGSSDTIIVSSGHSPSGEYHFGTVREVMTASMVAWAVNQKGHKAQHIDFVDDFDAFRKVPKGTPAEYEQYIGVPLYLVPDSQGDCHDTWADHWYDSFLDKLKEAGADPKVYRAHQVYLSGVFTPYIEAALSNLDKIRTIIKQHGGGRELPRDWAPVQILSDDNNLREWKYTGWDKDRQIVLYEDQDGTSGEVDYTTGRVKLDWRLDWPARWHMLGVSVEPFGRDHATKGGSYDTGKELVKQIYDGIAPFPVPYEFINPAGDTKKFSKSSGDVVTLADVLDVMPAEILRYFLIRSKPSKTLVYDSGVGLYALIDEYSKVEEAVHNGQDHEFAHAYAAANSSGGERTIARIPFNHLVSTYQAAQGNEAEILKMLERTGFESVVAEQKDVLLREIPYVKNWLAKYAPESVKFEVQKELPDVELSEGQKNFVTILAGSLEKTGELDGPAMHQAIYSAKEEADIKPGDAFQALYRLILGKDSGPKAGYFLSSLDRGWLIKRLRSEN